MIAAEHSVPEWGMHRKHEMDYAPEWGMQGEYRQFHHLWDHRMHFDARPHCFGPWRGGLY